jgi:MarR family transcriptional regulator, transcriptional regulator for hemolysin
MEVYMGPEIFHTPGHLINRLSRLMLRLGDERFQPLGLAIAQLPVLYALKDGSSLTQTELAKLAQIEQPTMAQLLVRMERDKLIRRTANPQDRRSSLISLTPLALKRLPAARAVLSEGNKEALQGFTDREAATLSRLLMRVVKNLDPAAAARIEAERGR